MASSILNTLAQRFGLYNSDSNLAKQRIQSMTDKLNCGETIYLGGIIPAGHNSGVALVEASHERGINLICNHEEERYKGIKHYAGYPEQSIETLRETLRHRNLTFEDIDVWVTGWDYVKACAFGFATALEEAPSSLTLINPAACPAMNVMHVWGAFQAPDRLSSQLGLRARLPLISMPHHDNHAYFSFGVSPFSRSSDPVIVTVIDGFGDDASVSIYLAKEGRLVKKYSNRSITDSLGVLYAQISSTQGGWTSLSSEGRYMGAVAWGNNDRLTNPYYRRVRQLIYFEDGGRFFINRKLANWQRKGEIRPYTRELEKILGEAIPKSRMWNPDAVLDVDKVDFAVLDKERLDKAAAVQMLFEDCLFHILDHAIRTMDSDKLVCTGGTALNCLATMRLLEHFDERYYARYLGRSDTRLQVWVPPTPGDAGVPPGAAFRFASACGAPWGSRLKHAFYCGEAYSSGEILDALNSTSEIGFLKFADLRTMEGLQQTADFMAFVVANDGFMGIFEGAAETGPRALGHRSILANPCNPETLDYLNRKVKFRERIRPLAPMVTVESAHRWFELSPGASAEGYNAYEYMVLTAKARPESREQIPAVIHEDGTARIQVVREETNPLIHFYLRCMGRRLGAEVSVNTSLNVGSPLAQTPVQALHTLKRSKGLDGLILIGSNGEVFLSWHNVDKDLKDRGQRLNEWLRHWKSQVGVDCLAGKIN